MVNFWISFPRKEMELWLIKTISKCLIKSSKVEVQGLAQGGAARQTETIPSQAPVFSKSQHSDDAVVKKGMSENSESPLSIKFVSNDNTDSLLNLPTYWKRSVQNKFIPPTKGQYLQLVGQSPASYSHPLYLKQRPSQLITRRAA